MKKGTRALYIDDESASRGLDWATTVFIYTAAFWTCIQAFRGFTL